MPDMEHLVAIRPRTAPHELSRGAHEAMHVTQVGLLVSSPIFAEASKHVNAFRLIALGLAVWTLATAGCGLAVGARFKGPVNAC